jgi:alkaline phosphatase D
VSVHRRSFLKAAAGLAIAGCGIPSPGRRDVVLTSALDAVAENPAVFPYGVQAGGVETTSVLLRSQAPTIDGAELWLWGADGEVLSREPLACDEHGYLRAEPAGLTPGTEHWYAFVTPDGGARSTVGRFVTSFAEDELRPLTLAGVTCTNWRYQPWRALERTALEDFDVLLHLGDMAYNDGAHTAEEYRASWRRALADPGYRALLPRAAMYHAWDDHEFWNNLDPEAEPERMSIARDAFFESLPQRQGEGGRLWRSYRWGLTAEILVLDARTERRPSTRETEGTFLGPEQLQWVDETLRNSPCRFKLLMNSVPITQMPWLWPEDGDKWSGWQIQRDAILEVLEDDDAARGTVFISGDTHTGFIAHVEETGIHRRILEVAVGPSGSANPFGWEILRGLTLPGGQFEYGSDRFAATTIRLDPDSGEMRVRFKDFETDELLHDGTYEPGV